MVEFNFWPGDETRVLHLCILVVSAAAELSDQLRYFETLHHVDVRVRQKRNADGHDVGTKDISFSAFGKDFNVVLSPGSPVLTADFKGTLVYGDGQSVPLYINENDFFTGHLSEDENIKADAHTEDGLWSASIYGNEDVYTLEPSWRHLPPSDNHSMIAYRHSDIKWNNLFPDLDKTPGKRKKLCGAIHPEDELDYNTQIEQEQEQEGAEKEENTVRPRRAVQEKNTCHILAVADYTFFKGPGGGFPHRTANYIIQTMQKVNRIYRDTIWSSESPLTGMGLQIKELRIHPEITAPSDYHKNGQHYNMHDDGTHWQDNVLLRQFGEDEELDKFCLAHLFTHRVFSGGILGLAYIASPRKYGLGGICSFKRENGIIFNIGFSSTQNTKGNNLLTQEAMLVTTHEIGHNWGAEHDAETTECAPNAFNRGKFVMYPYAVSGYDENNNEFSPCSKRYISAVLTTRSESCFKELTANGPLCGNGIINKGEACDGGGMGLSGLDLCCSRDCKLIGNATCSAANFECCKHCQMAPKNTLCRGASKELCQEAAFCTGLSLDCPMSDFLKDNTPCIDEGKCSKGVCLDFCAYEGQVLKKDLKPCRCEDAAHSCLRCCRLPNEACRPQNRSSSDSFLQDGRPCNYGYCEAGQCQKTSANMIQRLFAFIEHLDSSTFVAIMKSNIVGTVIVFSLVVWIPMSWIISCVDKHSEKKSREQDLRWISNDALLYQSLQSNILANQLKNYNVKDSKLLQAHRPQYQGYTNPEKPHHPDYSHPCDPSRPLLEERSKFYRSDGPIEMETVI